MPDYLIQPFDSSKHRREEFACESPELTTFLQTRARKEMAAGISACFVLVPKANPGCIAGFYTLSAAEIVTAHLPPDLAGKLPRYPAMPATLLGRLARALSLRGQGIGDRLMFDALARAWKTRLEVGSIAVITDPKDVTATAFYKSFNFLPLQGRRLFLPMGEIGKLMSSRG